MRAGSGAGRVKIVDVAEDAARPRAGWPAAHLTAVRLHASAPERLAAARAIQQL